MSEVPLGKHCNFSVLVFMQLLEGPSEADMLGWAAKPCKFETPATSDRVQGPLELLNLGLCFRSLKQ